MNNPTQGGRVPGSIVIQTTWMGSMPALLQMHVFVLWNALQENFIFECNQANDITKFQFCILDISSSVNKLSPLAKRGGENI